VYWRSQSRTSGFAGSTYQGSEWLENSRCDAFEVLSKTKAKDTYPILPISRLYYVLNHATFTYLFIEPLPARGARTSVTTTSKQ